MGGILTLGIGLGLGLGLFLWFASPGPAAAHPCGKARPVPVAAMATLSILPPSG